jgi:hypothetical protein
MAPNVAGIAAMTRGRWYLEPLRDLLKQLVHHALHLPPVRTVCVLCSRVSSVRGHDRATGWRSLPTFAPSRMQSLTGGSERYLPQDRVLLLRQQLLHLRGPTTTTGVDTVSRNAEESGPLRG